MRIVGGRWAGRDLVSPPDRRVRPTAEGVREGWMRILHPHLEGARLIDLFAGSGALGLEALSRGAAAADFVETRPASLHALRANLAALRLKDRCRVYRRDALDMAAHLDEGRYELALADPPYRSRMANRLVDLWLERRFATLLSVEHAADQVLPAGGRQFLFGTTAITTYGLES